MKTTFDNAVLRIQADITSFDNPIDIIHNDIPQYWRGNDLLIDLGIFSGNEVVDVSNIASITLDVRALTNDGEAPAANTPALMSCECRDLDNSVTLDTWKDGSTQHAQFRFKGADSNLKPGAYWLSIWASTNGESTKTLTIGAGIIRVLEDGGGIITTPPEPVEKYYTAEEIERRFLEVSRVDTDPSLGMSDDHIPSQAAVKKYVDSVVVDGGEKNTASNTGSGSGIFKEKIEAELVFKSLSAGNNISITSTDNEITISSDSGGVGTGGHVIQYTGNPLPPRDNLNFSDIFDVTDSATATNISLDANKFLQPGNNLSDIENKSDALNNLGGLGNQATINGKLLLSNPILSTDDIPEGVSKKYNIQSDWSSEDGESAILNKPILATVASSGKFDDLIDRPVLGTIALQDADNISIAGGTIQGITDLAVEDGGTGASTPEQARTNLGIGEVAVEDVVPVSKGGTGLSTLGTAGQVLSVNADGNALEWSTAAGGEDGMTNPMTTLGDIIIGGASGKPRRLRSPTTDGSYLLNSYVDDGRASIQWSSGVLVTSTWNSGANGFYRQYSDGWIEQGGIVDAGVKEISLYISMRYDTYTVLCNTIGEATDKTVMESQICPIKTTYSSITFSAASSAKRRWYVCGF